MLNAIATGLIALPARHRQARRGRPAATTSSHQADPASPASARFPIRAPAHGLRLHLPRGAGRRRATGSCSTAPASASTCARPGSRRARPRPAASTSSGWSSRDADLRRHGRAGRHAAAARPTTYAYSLTSRPASASPASRSRCSAATTRSASRSAPCCWPSSTQSAQPAGLRGRTPTRSWRHPGRHRALRRHRLRSRAALRLEPPAAAGRRANCRAGRRRADSRRWRRDRRATGTAAAGRRGRRRAAGAAACRLGSLLVVGVARRCCPRSASSPAPTTSTSRPISAALGLAVPIALAGLGGLWAERAGVVNIGLEGMMILGTLGAPGPATREPLGRRPRRRSSSARSAACCTRSPP